MADLHGAFGEVVRLHRVGRSQSQEALADDAKVHRTYISAVELGKVRIGLLVAKRLADALEVPLSTLVLEAEDRINGRDNRKVDSGPRRRFPVS